MAIVFATPPAILSNKIRLFWGLGLMAIIFALAKSKIIQLLIGFAFKHLSSI